MTNYRPTDDDVSMAEWLADDVPQQPDAQHTATPATAPASVQVYRQDPPYAHGPVLSEQEPVLSEDDGYSLADTLGASDVSYDTVIDRESAKEGLRHLPERERAILYMRYFEDMTQSRIADRLGISQMHVSRLISRSCARVRAEALGQRSRRARTTEA